MCGLSARAVLSGDTAWPEFVDQTPIRLIADASVGVDDDQEKDYAWGDVDNDGDTDLVIVRKEPFTRPGKRVNILLMNENGVLVDRTQDYATASDVPGDAGFATPTNDRDVVLVDVDGDGWLDIVTATTLTDNQAKHISHPRVYINLRDDPPNSGNWLGFEYQAARIPQMHATAGPRFCSVSAGDVTGDGYPDLYFSDYDDGVTNPPPQIYDYNDKLLINDGSGFFTDQSTLRMSPEMLLSNFGAASAIGDMNNDGVMDVVKHSALGPYDVGIAYNDPDNEGFFDSYDIIATGAPYFFSIGHLNGDEKLDVVIVDDGEDRFMIAGNNNGNGQRNYLDDTFPNSSGFGGNSLIADLNNDNLNDVIITDVDVDVPGCGGTTHIYQNQGGDMPSFVEQALAIPENMRIGWHDAAVFDINGDGWPDVVAGRCIGTQVWISQPPQGIEFAYPEGLPDVVTPEEPHAVVVRLTPTGGTVDSATALVHYAVDDGPFLEAPMQSLENDLFVAMLPAASCLSRIDFYFSAELAGGSVFRDPPLAVPAETYSAVAATGFEITFSESMEGDVSAWTVVSDPSLDAGEWEQAVPHGTIFNGALAAPEGDATAGSGNVMAFVTQNCTNDECTNAADSDVDGGPTYLISPTFDLSGLDATIRYTRWFYTSSSDGEDFLLTEVSNDGGQSWTSVHATPTTHSAWEVTEFAVSDFVAPSAEIRVRFGVADAFNAPDSSIVEAGIDDLEIERLVCEPAECEADLDGDGSVGASDLAALLGSWGPCAGCPADFDDDGTVGAFDLAVLLGDWGPCQ